MRLLHSLCQFFLAILVFTCIGVMICGVLLRYVLVPITNWLDIDAIGFFWVEEIGELTLTWLVMIGAAVGVSEYSHFYLSVLTHKLKPSAQKGLAIFNQGLITVFGSVVGVICFNLFLLNKSLTSPALEMSLGLYYLSASVGGAIMTVFTLNNCRKIILAQSPNTPQGH